MFHRPADHIFAARGIPVVPGILANAGGVVVSYFAWVQNTKNEPWDLEEVNRKLQERMVRATDAVLAKREEMERDLPAIEKALADTRKRRPVPDVGLKPVTLPAAAYVLAISRVAGVTIERGIWT